MREIVQSQPLILKSQNRDDFQDVPSYVSAMGKTFPKGFFNASHKHKRAQLIYAISGIMEISTTSNHWLLSPQVALWIPPEVEHQMRAKTNVELRTLWVRIGDLDRPLPLVPTLVHVTPLLRELIVRAVISPIEDTIPESTVPLFQLIFNELNASQSAGFHTVRVSDPRLARVEALLLENPGDMRGIGEWAALAGMSVRTFTRHLKAETGLSFSDWRQQHRLMEALLRIRAGEQITSVALSLGYENVGSLTRMFKRTIGFCPNAIARAHRGHSADLPNIDYKGSTDRK